MILENNTKYTFKQIAEWFNVSSRSFNNTKEKRLQELKRFCTYEILSAQKIQILEVNEPIYKKGETNYEKVVKAVNDLWGEGNGKMGLDTRVAVAKKIELEKEERQITTAESTNRKYAGQAIKNPTYSCSSQLSKVYINKNGIKEYFDFTPEELEIKHKIYVEVCTKDGVDEQSRINYENYKKGEITEKEYTDTQIQIQESGWCNWTLYKNRLAKEFKCDMVESCTDVKVGAFESK